MKKKSPVSARVRCKHCRAKVPLSPARMKELSVKLALTLDCPWCSQVFTTAMMREPVAVPAPPPPAPAPAATSPPPEPPFQPLLRRLEPRPPTSEKAPIFSPINLDAPPTPAGSKANWWKRLSPAKQKLVLAAAVAVMVIGMVAYESRPQPKPAAQQPAPAPPPKGS